MKTLLTLLAVLTFGAMAGAQEIPPETFPAEPYDFVLAKLAAAEGRTDEALALIDKVLAKNPGDPVVQYERAMMLIDANRIDDAEAALRNVIKANPDFYDARRILGRVLLDRSKGTDRAKMDEALEHLQAAYRLNPDDLSTGVTVSQILVASGKVAEAERILATMVERAPDQRAINYNYAQVLTKLGRGNESKQYLERAVQLDATFAPAVFQLLEIYQQSSEWVKAAEVLQPLIDEDPLNVELQRQQAYFYLRADQPERARATFKALVAADPKDDKSLFYLAEALNDLQQYGEADTIYRRLLEKAPNDPDLLASLGLAQVGQRKFDDATATFRRLLALEKAPENLATLSRTQLALIQLQKGNYDAAIAEASPVLVFNNKPNGQAVNIALDALRRQKKYAEAVALLQPLVDKYAQDVYVNARYIEMLARMGEKEKAAVAATTQAKFGTRNTVAAAEAYIAAGEPASGIKVLEDAVKTKPEEVDLRFQLGSAYERADRHQDAEKAFLSILEKNPEHAATLNYLGYMWAEQNTHLDRAADMLTRAVSQEPRNGAYVDSLGWVYYRQGKLELAEKYLSDAARLLPRDATVHEHLAEVMAKRGNTKRALELYKVALSLDPEPKEEEKLRSRIAELEKAGTAAQQR